MTRFCWTCLLGKRVHLVVLDSMGITTTRSLAFTNLSIQYCCSTASDFELFVHRPLWFTMHPTGHYDGWKCNSQLKCVVTWQLLETKHFIFFLYLFTVCYNIHLYHCPLVCKAYMSSSKKIMAKHCELQNFNVSILLIFKGIFFYKILFTISDYENNYLWEAIMTIKKTGMLFHFEVNTYFGLSIKFHSTFAHKPVKCIVTFFSFWRLASLSELQFWSLLTR